MENFFNICVLSRRKVYWILFQNVHTFSYQKLLLQTHFCLFLKSLIACSVSLSVSTRSLWYSSICQLGAYHILLAFLFYLVLILISTTNWDSVSNVWCQRYRHSTMLLTAPEVWDRSSCLWKTGLIVSWNKIENKVK